MYEFCTTCHSASGAARTDVVNGAFTTGSTLWGTPDEYGADDPAAGTPAYNKQLNGGLYGGAAMSTHKVLDTDEGSTLTLYGSGIDDGSDVTTDDFKCTSCHDPHGKQLDEVATTVTSQANGRTDNYRLLKSVPVYTWEDTGTTGNADLEADKSYTKQALENETGETDSGISEFCAVCHGDYLTTAPANVMGVPNAPGNVRYVHRENVAISAPYATNLYDSSYPLAVEEGTAFRGFYQTDGTTPTAADAADYSEWSGGLVVDAAYDGTNDRIMCLTCHNAHGTVATGDADAIAAYNRAGTHSLLRFDERAVCQSCHEKNPSY
jgi:mono/diheme cytochrome c family protein